MRRSAIAPQKPLCHALDIVGHSQLTELPPPFLESWSEPLWKLDFFLDFDLSLIRPLLGLNQWEWRGPGMGVLGKWWVQITACHVRLPASDEVCDGTML